MFRSFCYSLLLCLIISACQNKQIEKPHEEVSEYSSVKILQVAGTNPKGEFFYPKGDPNRYEYAPLIFHYGFIDEFGQDSVGVAFLSNQANKSNYKCEFIGKIHLEVQNIPRTLYLAIPLDDDLKTIESKSITLFALEHERYFHLLSTWLESYNGINQTRILEITD